MCTKKPCTKWWKVEGRRFLTATSLGVSPWSVSGGHRLTYRKAASGHPQGEVLVVTVKAADPRILLPVVYREDTRGAMTSNNKNDTARTSSTWGRTPESWCCVRPSSGGRRKG
jgi:hypothetical protein